MSNFRSDPLLGIFRVIIMVLMGLFGLVGSAMTIMIPAILIFQNDILHRLVADGKPDLGLPFLLVICVLLATLAVIMALVVWFFKYLLEIVKTVGDGDPFIEENATRLTRMGWIALGGHLWSYVPAGIGHYVANLVADPDGGADIGAGFDIGGVLLIFVLFILARVFREGARMRSELEGTV